jgi:hypothetical protein
MMMGRGGGFKKLLLDEGGRRAVEGVILPGRIAWIHVGRVCSDFGTKVSGTIEWEEGHSWGGK